jgi:hypothetical protein
MSKSRAEPSTAIVNLQTLGSVEEPAAAVSVKKDAAEATHVFRDTLYMSRTLITPNGRTIAVAKGRAVATTDADLQYLSWHPDLVRLQED